MRLFCNAITMYFISQILRYNCYTISYGVTTYKPSNDMLSMTKWHVILFKCMSLRLLHNKYGVIFYTQDTFLLHLPKLHMNYAFFGPNCWALWYVWFVLLPINSRLVYSLPHQIMGLMMSALNWVGSFQVLVIYFWHRPKLYSHITAQNIFSYNRPFWDKWHPDTPRRPEYCGPASTYLTQSTMCMTRAWRCANINEWLVWVFWHAWAHLPNVTFSFFWSWYDNILFFLIT